MITIIKVPTSYSCNGKTVGRLSTQARQWIRSFDHGQEICQGIGMVRSSGCRFSQNNNSHIHIIAVTKILTVKLYKKTYCGPQKLIWISFGPIGANLINILKEQNGLT